LEERRRSLEKSHGTLGNFGELSEFLDDGWYDKWETSCGMLGIYDGRRWLTCVGKIPQHNQWLG
jgi:hypothetical protein